MTDQKILTLKPDKIFQRIQDIPFHLLEEWGIRGIILDVDGTLLSRKEKEATKEVVSWLLEAKKQFNILIVSNNTPKKINRVSKPLDLPYIAWTIKPLRYFFRKALRQLDLPPEQVCTIGDQLFTDIEGGKRVGTRTIYVYPIAPQDDMCWTKTRRFFEKKYLSRWVKQIT
jgi:HAD superfamily phosphatase (TIGR01668 family)